MITTRLPFDVRQSKCAMAVISFGSVTLLGVLCDFYNFMCSDLKNGSRHSEENRTAPVG